MGELRRYDIPNVFEFNVGQVVDQNGKPTYDHPRASDGVIIDLNYRTGLAWVEPVRLVSHLRQSRRHSMGDRT